MSNEPDDFGTMMQRAHHAAMEKAVNAAVEIGKKQKTPLDANAEKLTKRDRVARHSARRLEPDLLAADLAFEQQRQGIDPSGDRPYPRDLIEAWKRDERDTREA